MNAVERLFYLSGISADYLDNWGQSRAIPHADRLRALSAMGFDGASVQAAERAVFELDAAPWRNRLQPYYIASTQQPAVQLHCHPGELSRQWRWRLQTESGELRSGSSQPRNLPEVGEYHIGDARYSARRLEFADLPAGYHRLQLEVDGECAETELVVCPEQAYQLAGRPRYWGISCQLYTLRSAQNWGVGDFGDLQELVALAAGLGADLIGLNPLHAPCSDSPDAASPYSPSDRRFLNPIYIDPRQVPGWAQVQRALPAAVLEQQASLSALDLVDYDAVNRLKYPLYEALYTEFLVTTQAQGLERFIAAGGTELAGFSDYEVRHNPFARQFSGQPRFFCYLQWLAAEQLAECQQRALDCGMAVGLMRDLAVGAVAPGCEVQQSQDLYLPGITVGAPPDNLAPAGQDWGLPVVNPLRMRQQCFAQFIHLLRSNMAACGALRVDHVMALMRLWWCLPATADHAATGLYVYYPRDELLALLRLESQRNATLVIGEDLGVVPEEFRKLMHNGHIYGNRLLYFERDHDGRFMAADAQPAECVLMVSNHDVPTLADWWDQTDLQRRAQLNLIADLAALEAQMQQRRVDKNQLLGWLDEQGLLPPSWPLAATEQGFDMALATALHRACARSQASVLLVQLEDLQLLHEPVNIPGTYREYPNWRRKQVRTTADLLAEVPVRQLLMAVNKERKH